MKRILQITGSLEKHGTQTFIMNVFRRVNKDKLMFDFLVEHPTLNGFEEEAKSHGADIFILPFSRLSFLKNYRKLNKFFKEKASEYDAVHYHSNSFCSLEVLFLAKKYGIKKIILHCHNSNTEGTLNRLLHKFYKTFLTGISTVWLACSDSAKLWGYGGTKIFDKAKVIRNCIDFEKFAYNPDVRQIVRKEWDAEDEIVFGTVGRLTKVKNQDFLIDVLLDLKNRGNESKLVLIGDGELRDDLEAKAKALGVANNVIFTGQRDDIGRLLNGIDVFVLPSLYEGFPFVAVEAQSNGLPCIFSTNISPEVILSDNSVMLPIENNSTEWADEIVKRCHSRVEVMGNKKIEQYFLENTLSTLEDIYEV